MKQIKSEELTTLITGIIGHKPELPLEIISNQSGTGISQNGVMSVHPICEPLNFLFIENGERVNQLHVRIDSLSLVEIKKTVLARLCP